MGRALDDTRPTRFSVLTFQNTQGLISSLRELEEAIYLLQDQIVTLKKVNATQAQLIDDLTLRVGDIEAYNKGKSLEDG